MRVAELFVDVVPQLDTGALRSALNRASRGADIEIEADIDGRDLSRKVERASDDAGKKGGRKLSGALGGALKTGLAGLGGAILAGGIGSMFSDIVGGASDLNETINKSTVIFGENATQIDKWAQGAARNLGLSRTEALNAAAGFGDMFSQLGFAGDEAAKMSTDVVQLSADLGSFNNLPTAEVADMMSAAFRGEYDSLQRLIPNINATRVETEALAMTGKDAASELTAQEKAAATLAIVQKDGARAAGDFAKTSDGLANSSKIAGAMFDDMKAALGQRLLPAMTGLMKFITDTALPGVSKLSDFLSDNSTTIKNVGIVLGTATAAWGTFMLVTQGIPAVLAAVKGAMIAVNAAMRANPIGVVVTLLGLLVGALVIAYQRSDTFREIVQRAWKGIQDAAKAVVNWFTGTALPFMQRVWEGISDAASYMWNRVLLPTFRAIQSGWDAMSKGIQALWNRVLKPVWDNVSAVIKWLWNTVLSVTFVAIRLGWLALSEGIKALWNRVLKPVWEAVARVGQWLWNNILKPTFERIRSGWDAALRAIKTIWERVLRPVFDAVRSGIDRVKSAFDTAQRGITRAWERIRDTAKAPIRFVVNTIINDAIIDNFNKIARFFNVKTIARVRLPRGFARGGKVDGPGTETSDSILARLSKNEFVVRASQAKKHRRLLEAINSGGLPGFAEGGVVGWVKDKVGNVVEGAKNIARGAMDFLTDPLGFLRKAVDNVIGRVGDFPFAKMAAAIPKKLLDAAIGSVTGMLSRQSAGTANGVGGLGPAARRAAAAVRQIFGFSGTIGGYANRNIAGTNKKSKHALGKAIDVMTYGNMRLGSQIANYFLRNRGLYGVDNIIWNRRITNAGRGWRWGRYTGVNPHLDHPHIDFYDRGGWLEKGATLAVNKTGKREAVMPEDVMLRAFRKAFAESGGQMGGVAFTQNGDVTIQEKVDIRQAMQEMSLLASHGAGL